MTEFKKKVDSEWKRKAREEAEKLSRKNTEKEEDEGMPKPSILELVRMLALQAQVALGAPDPATGARRPNPPAAQMSIALLETLQEKTKGNLDPQEAQVMSSVVSELKMAFVRVMG